jgi:hypothetical protein
MALSLQDALELSSALGERLAAAPVSSRDDLRRKKAMVDFVAFGMFKESNFRNALAWGAGLGLPALGVGHLLLRDARHQGGELVRDARNQALLTALGIGGVQSLGSALSGALAPSSREELNELTLPSGDQFAGRNVVKLSADRSALERKLAATLLVDDVLCAELTKNASDQRADLEECLLLNRQAGIDLLHQLL